MAGLDQFDVPLPLMLLQLRILDDDGTIAYDVRRYFQTTPHLKRELLEMQGMCQLWHAELSVEAVAHRSRQVKHEAAAAKPPT